MCSKHIAIFMNPNLMALLLTTATITHFPLKPNRIPPVYREYYAGNIFCGI